MNILGEKIKAVLDVRAFVEAIQKNVDWCDKDYVVIDVYNCDEVYEVKHKKFVKVLEGE